MTLARVGSGEGPDLRTHRRDRRRAPAAAASMPREACATAPIIEALQAAGAAGVLIATALHAGTIKAGDLKEIAGL